MNKVVTFENEDSRHKISIIQSVSGEVGFDPLHQRTALGVKWVEFGDETVYRGFWFDTTDIDPLEATSEFAGRLLAMLVDPDAHVLKDGITPVQSRLVADDDVSD